MYVVRHPESFDSTPELGMGFHFGITMDLVNAEPVIVLNGTIGLTIDDFFIDRLAQAAQGATIPMSEGQVLGNAPVRTIVPSDDVKLFVRSFGRWTSRIEALLQRERLHESPPFSITFSKPEKLVRFSAFSKDRRVQPDNSLLPGTYVTSERDANHAPSGCAVVGRYALPNPLPAIHQFDIAIPAGYPGLVGTVAPAFGQAGGGAEIELTSGSPPTSVSGPSILPIY